MNRVLVIDKNKQPLMPCHPARARELLRKGGAAVYRRAPFTIILLQREGGDVQPIEQKLNPCSKTSGIAFVADFTQKGPTLIFAANLKHHGLLIKGALLARSKIRRNRRNRKTRYRQCRYQTALGKNKFGRPRKTNRKFKELYGGKHLQPSLKSRVDNLVSITTKFSRIIPVTGFTVETLRFDTQKMQNPEISGVEYQQGELFGYEVREYLLEKWGRLCAYCDAKDVPLQIEHIHPKSRGGTDRVSNITLACECCNQTKDNLPVKVFLAHDAKRLKHILAQAKTPLKDAAAINSSRYAVGNKIKAFGLPTEFCISSRTKMNRITQNYPKDHFIDAACSGVAGAKVFIKPDFKPLTITAMGRGNRQKTRVDGNGFPCAAPKKGKRVNGIQTGDMVEITQPKGKYAGHYTARVSAIRPEGPISIQLNGKQTWFSSKLARIVQRNDGYRYDY